MEGVRELIQLLQIKSDFLSDKSTESPVSHSQDKENQRQSETQNFESGTDSTSSVIGKEVLGKQSSEEVSSECSVSSEKSGTKSRVQELPVLVKTEAAEDEEDREEIAAEDDNIQRQRFTPARRRSSLNPVNLSLSNPDQSNDSPRSPGVDTSDTVAKVCYFHSFELLTLLAGGSR